MSDRMELQSVLEQLLEQCNQLSEENERLKGQMQEIKNSLERQQKQPNVNYLEFEMRYRGPREEIKNRQMLYLPYFIGKNNVLDLGCGRGEFVELLLEHNVSVKGVDYDQGMVSFCQQQGLPVIYSEVVTFLEGVPDESLGGVFLGQVIEHLSPALFVDVVKLCYRKLLPEAFFVAETPNPESIAVFTHSFYLDLTHVKPIHSLAASFVLETSGFKDVQVIYSSPLPEEYHLPTNLENLGIDSKAAAVLRKWEGMLFGCQDYAVIGRR